MGKLDTTMHDRYLYNSAGMLMMDPKQSDLAYLSIMLGYLPSKEPQTELNTKSSSKYEP